MSEPTIERRDELAANLAEVRGRIAAACEQAGRDPEEITVVVVTKFFPASDVRLLAELGITDIGENRHQEAEAKAAECARPRRSLAFRRRPAEQQGGGRGGVLRRRGVGRPRQAGPAAGLRGTRRGRTPSTA